MCMWGCVCVACRGIVLINQRPWTWKRISLQYCNLNQQMQIIFLYIYSCVRCGYLFDFVIACRSFVWERFFSLFLLHVFDILDNIVPIHIKYIFICTPTTENALRWSALHACMQNSTGRDKKKKQNVVINTRFSLTL